MPITTKAPGREFPLAGSDQRHQYPWDDLSVGDWFFIPRSGYARKGARVEEVQIQGKMGQLIKDRAANGDKRKYMHFRADHNGEPGVKVMRIK